MSLLLEQNKSVLALHCDKPNRNKTQSKVLYPYLSEVFNLDVKLNAKYYSITFIEYCRTFKECYWTFKEFYRTFKKWSNGRNFTKPNQYSNKVVHPFPKVLNLEVKWNLKECSKTVKECSGTFI